MVLYLPAQTAYERDNLGHTPKETFRSSHFPDEPNPLGHVRFNDRTGPNGEKLLHLEELQSDWHQKGRKVGYSDETDQTRAKMRDAGHRAEQAYDGMMDAIKRNDALGFDQPWQAKNAIIQHPDWATRWDIRNPEDVAAIQKWVDARNEAQELAKTGHEVPDAPFKKTWPELLMKRMVRYAAENGYDGISWTPGEQQAERYDLSKQIDRVTYDPKTSRLTAELPNGVRHIDKAVAPGELADYIGKEGAQKLLARPVDRGLQVLENPDLKVGGEGMKGFYDKIVPDIANKLGKPFGAKVGDTTIEATPKRSRNLRVEPATLGRWQVTEDGQTGTVAGPFDTRAEADENLVSLRKQGPMKVPYLPIPEAMRKSALEQGQPLFKREATQEKKQERETTATTINRDTGKSLEDTIGDLSKLPKGKMTMAEHIENGVDHALTGVADTGNALTKAWNGMKGAAAGAYQSWSSPTPWTDYHTSLGDLRSAEFKAAIDINKYQHELKRVAPNERTRAAMTVYGEARSAEQLRNWATQASGFKDKNLARAFTDALNLTPEQKAMSAVHAKYYDQQLKILTDAGLLPQGVSHYAMHMYASDPETMAKLQAATDLSELSPNPSFLKKRVYPTYFEAIANGEKPVTLDAGKILSAYHDAFTKTFMTRAFIRSLLYGVDPEDGRPLAVLESRAGWVQVDNDRAGRAQILRQPKRPEDLTGYVRIPAGQVKNFKWELSDEDKEMLAPGFNKMPEDEQAKLFGPEDPRFPVPAGKVMAMKGDILIHPKYAGRVADLVTRRLAAIGRRPAALEGRH